MNCKTLYRIEEDAARTRRLVKYIEGRGIGLECYPNTFLDRLRTAIVNLVWNSRPLNGKSNQATPECRAGVPNTTQAQSKKNPF
jgi:hypothetical protein